ncbi:MAG: hypothetical protein AB7R90_21005 [Reyranellaceae bacterium]
MSRVYYSNTASGRNTTTSTSYGDQVSLTFTPNASKTYLILWGCLLDNNNTNNDSRARLYHDTAASALQTFNFEAQDVTDNYQIAAAALYTAPGSPTSQTFSVEFSSESTNTTGCQDAYLIALELAASDLTSATAAEQTTTNATMTDIGPAVVVGAGDWLLIASAEIGANASVDAGNNWEIHDGTSQIAVTGPAYTQDSSNYVPWWQIAKVSPGGTTTYKLRHKVGAGTARARNTSLIALDLSQFSDVIYAEDMSAGTVNSSSATTRLSVTDTPAAVDYLQLFCGSIKISSTTLSSYMDYTRGGSPISVETERENNDTDETYDQGYAAVSTLTASSTTWAIRHRGESSVPTVTTKNAAIAILQLGAGVTHYSIDAASASLQITPSTAGVAASRKLVAAQASIQLAGQAAALEYEPAAAALNAEAASLQITPYAVGLATARHLQAEQATLELAAQDVLLSCGRNIVAAVGQLDIAAPSIALAVARMLQAAAGSLALTGQAAAFGRSYTLVAANGALHISAAAAALEYDGIFPVILLPDLRSCWSPENLLRLATVSASSEAGGLPLSNAIADPHGGTVWRALASTVTVSAAWATSVPLRAFALARTSLSPLARLYIRLSNVAPGDAEAWDSDWLAGDVEPGFAQWVLVIEAAISARYMQLDIVDPGNASGYIDTGFLWAGDAFETVFNPVWGLAVGHDDPSQGRASLGGQTYNVVRPPVRVARGAYDLLPDEQAQGELLDLARAGSQANVLFVPQPGIRARNREAVIGLLQKSHRLPVTAFGRTAWDFEIRERL